LNAYTPVHLQFFGNWDRCYDFLNIFAEFFGEKIGAFDTKQC
jgi:hypothetical protein